MTKLTLPSLTPRSPALVLVFALLTCGLYLVYWYAQVYEELRAVTGEAPTSTGYWLDLLLVIVTCGLYGVWVDYRISECLRQFEVRRGAMHPRDTGLLAVVLDVAAYLTGFVTNFVSSAIHQDQMNKLIEQQNRLLESEPAAPTGTP